MNAQQVELKARKAIYAASSADGKVTRATIADRVLDALFDLIRLADEFADLSGPEKKQWVMRHVEELIDRLLPLIPYPIWLVPFKPFIESFLRRELLQLADLAIETILKRLRESQS